MLLLMYCSFSDLILTRKQHNSTEVFFYGFITEQQLKVLRLGDPTFSADQYLNSEGENSEEENSDLCCVVLSPGDVLYHPAGIYSYIHTYICIYIIFIDTYILLYPKAILFFCLLSTQNVVIVTWKAYYGYIMKCSIIHMAYLKTLKLICYFIMLKQIMISHSILIFE